MQKWAIVCVFVLIPGASATAASPAVYADDVRGYDASTTRKRDFFDHMYTTGIRMFTYKLQQMEEFNAEANVTETTETDKPKPIGKWIQFMCTMAKDYRFIHGDKLIFDTIWVNNGSAFDHRTNSFVAPINGTYFLYYFSYSKRTGIPGDGDIHTALMQGHNGTSLRKEANSECTWWRTGNYYQGMCIIIHGPVLLEAGDTLWLEVRGFNVQFDRNHTVFTGFLIEPENTTELLSLDTSLWSMF